MAALGTLVPLTLAASPTLLLFAGLRSGNEGVKRFSFVAAAILAVYMMAAIVFSQSPLYGVVFVLLGLVLLASMETSMSRARPD